MIRNPIGTNLIQVLKDFYNYITCPKSELDIITRQTHPNVMPLWRYVLVQMQCKVYTLKQHI